MTACHCYHCTSCPRLDSTKQYLVARPFVQVVVPCVTKITVQRLPRILAVVATILGGIVVIVLEITAFTTAMVVSVLEQGALEEVLDVDCVDSSNRADSLDDGC